MPPPLLSPARVGKRTISPTFRSPRQDGTTVRLYGRSAQGQVGCDERHLYNCKTSAARDGAAGAGGSGFLVSGWERIFSSTRSPSTPSRIRQGAQSIRGQVRRRAGVAFPHRQRRKTSSSRPRKLGLSRVRDSVRKDGHSASLMVGNGTRGTVDAQLRRGQPQFLATTIASFLGWKDAAPVKSYAEARPLVLDQGEYFFQKPVQRLPHHRARATRWDRTSRA